MFFLSSAHKSATRGGACAVNSGPEIAKPASLICQGVEIGHQGLFLFGRTEQTNLISLKNHFAVTEAGLEKTSSASFAICHGEISLI
jgi:hypothetical protein